MAITGIISEYNPFHNGHKYLIEQALERQPDQSFIAVMSGNITQRGEMAILNKWQRAEIAVNNGIDLVLELPCCFAVRSAEHFARGGIQLLQRLNCVDTVCCGAEDTDVEKLTRIWELTQQPEYIQHLRTELNSGKAYAVAHSSAIASLWNPQEACEEVLNLLKAPNFTLAYTYLKAITELAAPMNLQLIKRQQAQHNDLHYTGNFASGTAIRHHLFQETTDLQDLSTVVPPLSYELLKNSLEKQHLPDEQQFYRLLQYELLQNTPASLREIYGMNEGLEHKILSLYQQCSGMSDLLKNIKSKRYAYTRLQRLLCHILLRISHQNMAEFDHTGPLYARVLAFSPKGQGILKQLKTMSDLPIIIKTATVLNSKKRCQPQLTTLEKMLSLDIRATDIYNLSQRQLRPLGEDFIHSPYILKP